MYAAYLIEIKVIESSLPTNWIAYWWSSSCFWKFSI